jgi:APA family basic amino acid/polyamine antiporter
MAAGHSASRDADTGAQRPRIGVVSAAALVVSHTIAVGIFLTPAELIGALASPALTLGVWLTGGVIVLAGAMTFGELASRFPRAGGIYVYLNEAWGPRIAFLYGWQALLVMDPGVTAALAAGAAQYASVIWPALAGNERAVAVGLIAAVVLANVFGLRLGARVFAVLTIAKLCTLAAIVCAAVVSGAGSWANFVPFAGARTGAPPLGAALAVGLVSVFFSFGGFWETSRIAAEITDPRRNLPRALIGGVLAVTLIYVMTTVAFMYLVPASAATSAAEFARLAGLALAGPSGPTLLAGVVLVSVVASVMAMVMVAPRLYEAMSRDGLFPYTFGRRGPANAPVRSTLLLGVLSSIFVVAGTFDQIVSFFIVTALAFLALAAGAVIIVRRRDKGELPRAVFAAPGYPVTPALFIGLVVAIVLMVAVTRPVEALAGMAIVSLGLVVYGRLAALPRVGHSE